MLHGSCTVACYFQLCNNWNVSISTWAVIYVSVGCE